MRSCFVVSHVLSTHHLLHLNVLSAAKRCVSADLVASLRVHIVVLFVITRRYFHPEAIFSIAGAELRKGKCFLAWSVHFNKRRTVFEGYCFMYVDL